MVGLTEVAQQNRAVSLQGVDMDLPDVLTSEVRAGRVVLALGVGASMGCTTPRGKPPLLGRELRDVLAQQFLGGRFQNESLAWVADLAISAKDLASVQDFIADQFRDLEPAPFHCLLPTFKWRGIATTNYDCLIEQIYRQAPKALQRIVPFVSNSDRVDERLRAPDHLELLKLHGCITRTHDPSLPLILTVDQYVTQDEQGSAFSNANRMECGEHGRVCGSTTGGPGPQSSPLGGLEGIEHTTSLLFC